MRQEKDNVSEIWRTSVVGGPKLDIGKALIIFSYVPSPTKLTNAISKTQLSGPKKGVFLQKIPRMWPVFCIWRVLAVFSVLKPAE